jgi:hypothetical protein
MMEARNANPSKISKQGVNGNLLLSTLPHACGGPKCTSWAPMMYNTTSSDEEQDDEEIMMAGMSDNDKVLNKQRRPKSQGSNTIVNIKRDAFFTVPELIAKRMNRRIAHHPCSAQMQSSCVWCCQMDHSRGQQHIRHGRKTAWYCSICEVSVCKVKRYNDWSYFILFHVSLNLFDPCYLLKKGAMYTLVG